MPVVLDLSQTYRPTEKQALAHSLSETYVLFGGTMGSGKSVWLTNEALQLSLDYPFNRGFIGRWENKTFKNTTYLTMQHYIPHQIISRQHLSDQYIDLVNGSRIYYGGLKPSGSSNPIDKFKSMDLGWFAIDESSEVPEDSFLILASRLRLNIPNVRYKGIMSSNPEPGWLRSRFIEKKLPDHKFIPALPGDNPHLPDDYEERLRALFPPEWVERYLQGSWDVMLEGNYIFPFQWVRAAVQRDLDEAAPIELGVDIAAGGKNMTIAACRWGPVVRIVHRSSYFNTMQTAGVIAMLIDEHGVSRCRIDVVGVGKGVYDRLKEQKKYQDVVEPYVSGEKARKQGEAVKYGNRRAQDHWQFRETLENGEVDLPDDEQVTSQLSGIKYKVKSDKTLFVESKEEMSARGFPSPDDAEAVVMAFSESKSRKQGVVFGYGGR